MEYKRYELDTAISRTDEVLEFGAVYTNFLFLVNDVPVEFKINSQEADTLYASELQGFDNRVSSFERLYITNTPGTGKIVILVYR